MMCILEAKEGISCFTRARWHAEVINESPNDRENGSKANKPLVGKVNILIFLVPHFLSFRSLFQRAKNENTTIAHKQPTWAKVVMQILSPVSRVTDSSELYLHENYVWQGELWAKFTFWKPSCSADDSTRVVLDVIGEDESSDFINANYIDVSKTAKRIMCTSCCCMSYTKPLQKA